MVSGFGNCAYKYSNSRGKPVFVPTENGRKVGRELKRKLDRCFKPDFFFYHLRDGGHVAALHIHRKNRYFARVDIENFFYSIGRNRVVRCLQQLGFAGAEKYGKWSTVKNPCGQPTYSLPYGFVQSPILATLVLSRSDLGDFLRSISVDFTVSVYMDDIAISGNNLRKLQRVYRNVCQKLVVSKFPINAKKSIAPARAVELLNCQLSHLNSLVTADRRTEFYAQARSSLSQIAFEEYCKSVEDGNV
jgi:hypothetical protein